MGKLNFTLIRNFTRKETELIIHGLVRKVENMDSWCNTKTSATEIVFKKNTSNLILPYNTFPSHNSFHGKFSL